MIDTWTFAGLSVEIGQKVCGYVRLPGVDHDIAVTLIHGEQDGPTAVIFGGIHGCEYTSIDAAIRLSQKLTPDTVAGKVAVIPVINVAAYASRSIYVHPEDGKNLNRVFPGLQNGSAAERLAYQVTEQFIRPCDYFIDLHGGDMNEALVPFVLYHVSFDGDLNTRAAHLANAFGIQYVVAGETNGSTYEAAASLGKVAILAEAGQQGILDPEGSELLVGGSMNSLRSIHMLAGEPRVHDCVVELQEFAWTRSDRFGGWYPLVRVGDTVEAGQKAGEILNFFGNVVEEVFVSVPGTVLFCVTSLAINEGDPLFAVGR